MKQPRKYNSERVCIEFEVESRVSKTGEIFYFVSWPCKPDGVREVAFKSMFSVLDFIHSNWSIPNRRTDEIFDFGSR